MSQPFGATNVPDTCKWCGRLFKLETKYVVHGLRSGCCDAPVEAYEEPYTDAWAPKQPKTRERQRCTACDKAPCGFTHQSEHVPTGRRRGYNNSEHFCTLRCGHEFAEVMARGGSLLEPKGKTDD